MSAPFVSGGQQRRAGEQAHRSIGSLAWWALALALLLGRSAAAQLSVDWNSCRTRLSLPPVQDAVTYEFIRVCSHPCSRWLLTECELLAVTSTPAHEFVLGVGFHGRFRVVAKDSAGSPVLTLDSANVNADFQANGAPVLDDAARIVRGFLGESILVSTSDVPPDVSVEWLRDGAPIPRGIRLVVPALDRRFAPRRTARTRRVERMWRHGRRREDHRGAGYPGGWAD